MAKRRLTKAIDADEGTVTVTVPGQEPIRLSLEELPPDIIRRAALHGLAQKLGDSVAGARARGMTSVDEAATIRELAERLRAGEWNARGGTGASLLAEAIARITGKPIEVVRARLADMPDDMRNELARRPDVKAMVHRIRAERLAQAADGEELGELF